MKPQRYYSLEGFVIRAREVHCEKYDYSKVIYSNSKTKVIIICPLHGEFMQEPRNHVAKRGCARCSPYSEGSTERFLKKSKESHGDKYDYSKVVYMNKKNKSYNYL